MVGLSVVPRNLETQSNDSFSTSSAMSMRVGEETMPGRTVGTFRLELWGPLSCGLGEAGSGRLQRGT